MRRPYVDRVIRPLALALTVALAFVAVILWLFAADDGAGCAAAFALIFGLGWLLSRPQ